MPLPPVDLTVAFEHEETLVGAAFDETAASFCLEGIALSLRRSLPQRTSAPIAFLTADCPEVVARQEDA